MNARQQGGIGGLPKALMPGALVGEDAAGWWVRLGQAVDELARRYPRMYGATIPATWRDDLETVELLASITTWRRELDEQHRAQGDEHDVGDDEESA